MNKDPFVYFIWQCELVLICGIIGLIAVFIKIGLPADVSVVFAIVFAFCILTALFFLNRARQTIKQEREDRLVDSIGEVD